MIGLFLILGSAIPILLAFSLIYVRNPKGLGWALWAISLGFMAYAWLWVTGIIPSDGAQTYGFIYALWFSWAPFVALYLKRRGKRLK